MTYFTLAMTQKRGLGSLAGAIDPYPTQSEIIKRVASQFLHPELAEAVKTHAVYVKFLEYDWSLNTKEGTP